MLDAGLGLVTRRLGGQTQCLVVGAVAQHPDQGQEGGDDGDGHRYLAIEGIMGRVAGMFGVLDVMFGSVSHVCPAKGE